MEGLPARLPGPRALEGRDGLRRAGGVGDAPGACGDPGSGRRGRGEARREQEGSRRGRASRGVPAEGGPLEGREHLQDRQGELQLGEATSSTIASLTATSTRRRATVSWTTSAKGPPPWSSTSRTRPAEWEDAKERLATVLKERTDAEKELSVPDPRAPARRSQDRPARPRSDAGPSSPTSSATSPAWTSSGRT